LTAPLLLCLGLAGPAAALAWDPWKAGPDPEPVARAAPARLRDQTGPLRIAGLLSIRVYQRTLSRVLASGCQFSPSCSAYTFRCIASHGLINGTWMGADRLSRCHGFAVLGGYPVARSGALIDPPDEAKPPLPVLAWLGL